MVSRRTLYAILSVGVIGTFFGHGAWAVGAKDSFLGLLTDSLDNVFGYTLSASTAETVVRGIGAFDIAVAIVMALMLIGALRGTGRLYSLAYSKTALVVYGWAVVWGFATAASRMTAAGAFFPEVWDWVERAPNFMLPAALFYIVATSRRAHPEAPVFVPDTFHQALEETKEEASGAR